MKNWRKILGIILIILSFSIFILVLSTVFPLVFVLIRFGIAVAITVLFFSGAYLLTD